MRKYRCWVMSIIQQYERFRDSPVRSSVMGNSRLLFLLKQRDRIDLDHIAESFPLPEVTKAAIGGFPEPGGDGGKRHRTSPTTGWRTASPGWRSKTRRPGRCWERRRGMHVER
ncbi:MAG: hypothetical protein R3F11_18805 [Verrucomicrobiales bacterium]